MKRSTSANLSYGNSKTEIYSNLIASVISETSPLIFDTNTDMDTELLKSVVQNALPSDRLVLVIVTQQGGDGVVKDIGFPTLTITYTPPQQNVTVKQKLSSGTEFGQIGYWETNQWQNYPSGHTFPFGINNTEYLQSETTIYNNEKFNNWEDNISSSYINFNNYLVRKNVNQLVSSFDHVDQVSINFSSENISNQYGSIKLKDPWFRDDNSDPKGNRNRGTNAIWHSYSSPLNVATSGAHQGVFLGQNPTFDSQLPIYSVKAESPQTVNINGSNHKFYFQYWSGSSASFQDSNALKTPVVFNNSGATVKAVMKGTQLSNDAAAYSNNSQRKFVRTSDGTLYMVYESLGHVWYEMSTDNGATWSLGNGGKPLDSNGGKLPSIASHGHDISIVWEEKSGGAAEIQIACGSGLSLYSGYPKNVFVDITQSYSNDLNPVIA